LNRSQSPALTTTHFGRKVWATVVSIFVVAGAIAAIIVLV